VPRCIAIIPARYSSSRFPGKPLAQLGGKPLVQHVLERAHEAGVFDAVWVATDDERIADAVRAAGGEARMTRSDHATGTERVAELAADLPADSLIVNVQGDEPLLPPALLQDLVRCAHEGLDIVTAAYPAVDEGAFRSPHVVKVVLDRRGDALYFSRAPIPHALDAESRWLRHVGLYAFRQAALARFVSLPPADLERREGLEQLRALENGMRIHVLVTRHETLGVDTPEDLKAVAIRLGASLESGRSTASPSSASWPPKARA
jgi:3-deoxy-manno-octulosonate cytidylyltransferase (CMP-KDO synthetase)